MLYFDLFPSTSFICHLIFLILYLVFDYIFWVTSIWWVNSVYLWVMKSISWIFLSNISFAISLFFSIISFIGSWVFESSSTFFLQISIKDLNFFTLRRFLYLRLYSDLNQKRYQYSNKKQSNILINQHFNIGLKERDLINIGTF